MTVISKLARAVTVTLLVGTTAAAMAQSASAPVQASSPAKKALIDKALQLQMPTLENVGAALAQQSIQALAQAANQAIGQFPPERRELLANEVQAEFRKYGDEVLPILRAATTKLVPTSYGSMLESNFSEDELKTLIAWLESPVSKKLQRIGGEGVVALQQKIVAETRGTIEPKLKALEQSIGNKIKAAATAAGASAPAAQPARPAASGTKK